MKERINWIDWAKALAACSVVFCHLPQSQEWFYYRYLQALTMVVFFFISGYLKKDRGSDKENWKKYSYGLIIPYILYNIIVYPYWILKLYLNNGAMPDFFQAMKPILGALLLEHENSFCEPLNGPLWYLPAILMMHIIIDMCRKTKYQHWIMIILCVISFILYTANKFWYFAPNLTPMGLLRNLPYYYIGYLFGQYHLFRETNLKKDIIGCIIFSQHSSFRLASRSIPFRSTYTAYRPLLPYQCTFPLRSSLWMQDSQWCPTFCGNKHFHWHPHHRRFTYRCCYDSKLYSFIFSPF